MAVAESVGGIVQHVLEDSLHVALFGAAQLFAPHSLILADEVRWCVPPALAVAANQLPHSACLL